MVDCTCCFTEGCPGSQLIIAFPLHRCRFSKYDSLILMCLGKHSPNTNAALHAWANCCRCRLIILQTCILSWSVNSRTIPIIAVFAHPPSLWLITSTEALPVSYFHGVSLCAARKITRVQYLMEILVSGVVWLATFATVWTQLIKIPGLLHSQEKTHLNSFCTCGVQFCFITVCCSTPERFGRNCPHH